jgi:hypothetical protein
MVHDSKARSVANKAKTGATVALWLATVGWGTPAAAQRLENQMAVFAALDKVTGRISKLEVKLGETVTFGSLKLTPRVCYSRAPTEPPKTTTFLEVDEVLLDGKEKRIFSGWMFAESPGLNAVEHPVFDVWLTECTQPKTATAARPSSQPGQVATKQGAAVGASSSQGDDDLIRRRRPPR